MAPTVDIDVAALRGGEPSGQLELKRNARRNELALVDLRVVARDLDMLFGRKERVRTILVSAKSDDGGDMMLWASFVTEGHEVSPDARDVSVLSHRTLPVVPALPVLPAPSTVTLPRKGEVGVRGGTLRISSALPLPNKGGPARWAVRGELELELVPADGEATEAWSGRFKGQLVWP